MLGRRNAGVTDPVLPGVLSSGSSIVCSRIPVFDLERLVIVIECGNYYLESVAVLGGGADITVYCTQIAQCSSIETNVLRGCGRP